MDEDDIEVARWSKAGPGLSNSNSESQCGGKITAAAAAPMGVMTRITRFLTYYRADRNNAIDLRSERKKLVMFVLTQSVLRQQRREQLSAKLVGRV